MIELLIEPFAVMYIVFNVFIVKDIVLDYPMEHISFLAMLKKIKDSRKNLLSLSFFLAIVFPSFLVVSLLGIYSDIVKRFS